VLFYGETTAEVLCKEKREENMKIQQYTTKVDITKFDEQQELLYNKM